MSLANEATEKELAEIFPALKKYQKNHTENNLKKLCIEILEFCREVYASTRSEDEREVFKNMFDKLSNFI